MALVTPTEAIRLSGRSKASFYKDVKTGRVSKTQDGLGQTRFDTSELQRVYGSPKPRFTSASELAQTEQDTAQLRIMTQEIEHLRALLNAKDEQIQTLRDAMKLLEFRASQPVQQQTAADRPGLFGRIFGVRGKQ